MAAAAAGIEEQVRTALVRRLAWTVYESNDEALWARVRDTANSLLLSYWRDDELKGSMPNEAFYVRCGRDTMTQQDIDSGCLIVEVGIASISPATFVTVSIEQMVAGRPQRRRLQRWLTPKNRQSPNSRQCRTPTRCETNSKSGGLSAEPPTQSNKPEASSSSPPKPHTRSAPPFCWTAASRPGSLRSNS